MSYSNYPSDYIELSTSMPDNATNVLIDGQLINSGGLSTSSSLDWGNNSSLHGNVLYVFSSALLNLQYGELSFSASSGGVTTFSFNSQGGYPLHISIPYSSFSWTTVTLPVDSTACWPITFGKGMFVSPAQGASKVLYSTDGLSWSYNTMPFGAWYTVAYGNDLFMAGGANGLIATSKDGLNWTTSPIGYGTEHFYTIKYYQNKFVGLTSDGGTESFWSTDGSSYSFTTMPSSANWSGLAYGAGKWIATASNNRSAAISTDGITWTATTTALNQAHFHIAYGNGTFVAVSGVQNGEITTDGITWSSMTMPTNSDWYDVIFANNIFIAMAQSNGRIATSTNGITWTQSLLTDTVRFHLSLCIGNGKIVATNGSASAGANLIQVSNIAPPPDAPISFGVYLGQQKNV